MVDEGRGECRADHVFLISLEFMCSCAEQVYVVSAQSRGGCLAVWQGHGLLKVRPEPRSQLCPLEQWFLGEISNLLLQILFFICKWQGLYLPELLLGLELQEMNIVTGNQ